MTESDAELAAWLRLTLAPGVGPEKQRSLLAAFGLPEAVFASGRRAVAAVVGDAVAAKLFDADNAEAIAQGLAWRGEPGNAIVTLGDPEYPPTLLQTADPPLLLYVKGRVELLSRPALAVVGSRHASAQGLENAEAFSRALSAAGLLIVSGLALGIDAAAHRGGLDGVGGTLAFIGTGADRIYPARNASLARRIAESGAIVSEFPLGTPSVAHNFPKRNRLIAGLAQGVLVVEAAPASGSLITARLAGELGREVLAIPGSIHSPLSKGCHQLIKQGAKLVESAHDVLEELRWQVSVPAPLGRAEAVQAPPPASGAEADLLAALGFDPVDADTLCTRSKLTPDALFAILLELELAGRVARLPGGRFQRLQ
ncbi:DNA-processing protein DprA [Niveibacterium sp. 24ML]|uniref:DNA-processing protein DprA n=1 Tax=Niveibacterium sp. 24ML TaxID=2985512 RepID=UPI0022711030|nr:DNA-processing protein DprA [Niveibacterium sp. 24ML]MCX9157320.1 DNA-processing protein DprA [Niveibacterium sp. 24ML]